MNKIRRPQRSKRDRFMKKVTDITNTVKVYDDNFEKAFRIWKKKIRKSEIVQECRRRKQFIKPAEAKQVAKKKAIRREKKRVGMV